ncbi:MAG: NADH-quinone oxidoreductase subunit M, partial [Flavobacteriales bacterium]
MNLTLLLLIPMLTALVILTCRDLFSVRWVAFIGSVIQLALGGMLLVQYNAARAAGNTAQMLFESRTSWYAAWNIEYYVGVDGISIAMILLTAFVVAAGVLISWKMEVLTKEFFFLLMLLSVGAYGFFISLDLFTMFFFLEIAVLPKFLLIAIWGSGKKEYSAMKLALMLMAGSALVLIGILGIYFNTNDGSGHHTFDILKISQ